MPRRSSPKDFWKNVDIRSKEECWNWKISKDDHGYGRVRYHQKEWTASRLAYKFFYKDPGDLFVCHTCDNPACCNPHHFFLGTQKDNMQDMVNKGRHPRNKTGYLPTGKNHHSHLRPEVVARGERNGAARLIADDVKRIRAEARAGETHRFLAKKYNVAKSTITFITQGKTWKHLL